MKKILYLLLCMAIIFNFVACGSKLNGSNDAKTKKVSLESDKIKDDSKENAKTDNTEESKEQNNDEGSKEEKMAELYFSDEQAMYLNKEEVKCSEITAEFLIKKLQEGPKNSKNVSTIPSDLKISLEVKDSTAYVDLDAEVAKKLNGGSSSESMLVYSIVDTLVLNKELGIEKVQFLVDGKIQESINGHLDISGAIKPDLSMIQSK
ncbi:GerMN domain-containing protein [Haloimpatiens sp. FM7315]|uniref:GerMN domain-containing protein n=1 Tax=Haloimpatiens sp. FM7315 TaxID=3298609 RepID=UPI00370B6FB5